MLKLIISIAIFCEISLHDAIDKCVEKRSEISSFDCTYASVDYLDMKSNDGGIYQLHAKVETKGVLKFDQVTGLVLSRQRSKLLEVEGKPASYVQSFREDSRREGEKFQMLDESHDVVWDRRSLQMVVRRREYAPGYRDLPIYIHGLGLANVYDASKKTPLEQMAAELKARYPNVEASSVADGIAEFRLSSFLLSFDTKRDFWPTEQSRIRVDKDTGNLSVEESTRMSLVLVGETWMPSTVELRSFSGIKNFTFKWSSVNETVDPETVDLDAIKDEILVSIEAETRDRFGKSQSDK